MTAYFIRRLIVLVLTLLGASALVFHLIHLIPGDLVTILLGITASQNEATREALVRSLNLDRPVLEQFGLWLGGVLRGDLGASLVTGIPVREQLLRTFPVTLQLLLIAFVIAVVLGVPAGAFSALRVNRWPDSTLRVLSLFFISTPAFFIGMLFILGSSYVAFIPTLRYVRPEVDLWASTLTMLMPALALGLAMSAIVLRFTRTSMLEVLNQDFIRTGRAKGVSQRRLLFAHALRNAAVPVIAVLGSQFVQLLGNMIVIEQVFGLPGVGQLLVNAIYRKDYTTIQGIVVSLVAFSLVANLLLDLLYAVVDPRIRYT